MSSEREKEGGKERDGVGEQAHYQICVFGKIIEMKFGKKFRLQGKFSLCCLTYRGFDIKRSFGDDGDSKFEPNITTIICVVAMV